MGRGIGRLTALAVAKAKTPGFYPDGGGLYLQVTATGVKSWTFRFMLRGRARMMGLGPVHAVKLADARAKATACRQLRHAGVDPLDARREEAARARLEAAKAITFKDAADGYIKAHEAGWRNAKHADQWRNTLETYAYPVFGGLPVQRVDVALVMKVLEPIWATKTETASRVRGRIEAILDWATVRAYRQGDNPARWRGHLENLLPRRSKVKKVQHHAALPYREVAAFMASLHEEDGVAARALEFLILTAARTNEVTGARENEIDPEERLWTVPADRIKGEKEHRVPLSDAAMTIWRQAKRRPPKHTPSDAFIFGGGRSGKPLSHAAMTAVLKRMGCEDITVHGFRSTFRDWAAECTNYPSEVAEMALSHVVRNKTEAAYRRGDLFNKRRRLMEDWAKYCATKRSPASVVPLHGKTAAAAAS